MDKIIHILKLHQLIYKSIARKCPVPGNVLYLYNYRIYMYMYSEAFSLHLH